MQTQEKRTMVVLDGGAQYSQSAEVVAHWSKLSVAEGVESLPLMVERQGESLRAEYLALLFELGNAKVGSKSLVEKMSVRAGFSAWWMTLLVEKSPWKSKDIFPAFKALALNRLIKQSQVNCIVLCSVDQQLIGFLRSVVIEHHIELHILGEGQSEIKNQWFRQLTHLLQGLAFWGYSIIKFRKAFFRKPMVVRQQCENCDVMVVTYSDNFSIDALKHGEVLSGYWGQLHNLFDQRESKVNWLLLYTPSKYMPSFSAGLELIGNKIHHNEKRSFHFMEEWFSFGVIFKALKDFARLSLSSMSVDLSKLLRATTAACDLSVFLTDDWLSSAGGKVAMDNCLRLALFEAACESYGLQGKGLYLLENQAWERALCHAWSQFNQGKQSELVGFQHVSGRYFDLRQFNDIRCFDENEQIGPLLPSPAKLAVIGETARRMMLETGYPDNKIAMVEALRFLYLLEHNTADSSGEQNKQLLVVTDYIPHVSKFQLQLLDETLKSHPDLFDEIVLKPHPNCPVEPILKQLAVGFEYKIVDTPLSVLWSDAFVALISNTTNAALEAAIDGVAVVITLDEKGFNMSPLRGVEGASFASSPQELSEALQTAKVPDVAADYFCLDNDLTHWKALLR